MRKSRRRWFGEKLSGQEQQYLPEKGAGPQVAGLGSVGISRGSGHGPRPKATDIGKAAADRPPPEGLTRHTENSNPLVSTHPPTPHPYFLPSC